MDSMNSMDSMESLPDDLLRCVANSSTMSNRDRANLMCSCRRMRSALTFCVVTLVDASAARASRSALADALHSGRCEVLEGASVPITLLDSVGVERPERVVRLEEARVNAYIPHTRIAGLLSRATFPALTTIRLVSPVTNPIINDPRVVPEYASVICAAEPSLCVASGCVVTLELLVEGFNEHHVGVAVACFERARASNVRVLKLIIRDDRYDDTTPFVAERLAEAAASLAQGDIMCTSRPYILPFARHFCPARVKSLDFSYRSDLLVVLARRLVAPIELALRCFRIIIQFDDIIALARLVGRGLISFMTLKADSDTWSQIVNQLRFLRRVPELRLVSLTLVQAIELCWYGFDTKDDVVVDHTCTELSLDMEQEDASFNDTNLCRLAQCLSTWPHLRHVHMHRWLHPTVFGDNSDACYARFEATLAERTGGHVRVTFEGPKPTMYSCVCQ